MLVIKFYIVLSYCLLINLYFFFYLYLQFLNYILIDLSFQMLFLYRHLYLCYSNILSER